MDTGGVPAAGRLRAACMTAQITKWSRVILLPLDMRVAMAVAVLLMICKEGEGADSDGMR
jgi:hypothetical protein